MITTQPLITQFLQAKKKNIITDYFKPVNATQVKTEKLHFYKPATDYKKARHYLNKHRHLYSASTTKNGYCYCASSDFIDIVLCYQKIIDNPLANKNDKEKDKSAISLVFNHSTITALDLNNIGVP